MTFRKHLGFLAVCLALALAPGVAAAQARPAPLEGFIAQVARLWGAGDASELAGLAPADGRVLLDVRGEGPGEVQGRHVAAALRDLFGQRETVSVRSTQVTIAGGTPLRGFGELAWASRLRGVTETQRETVYVGAVWEGDAWRISEIRLMR